MELDEQTLNRKKRALKKYKRNKACIDRLEERLYVLDSRMKSAKSPDTSGMPKGGGTHMTTTDLIANKMELEERINRLVDKGNRLRLEILSEIDTLDDVRECEILEAYFIECKDFKDIADELGYHEKSVVRLYSRGVRHLAMIEVTSE